MTPSQPSVFAAAATAYRDVADALAAMRSLALVTFLIVLATEILNWGLNKWVIPVESLLGHEIMQIVISFLVTPFLIAVHRYVLRREITTRYVLEPSDRRFQLFFGWTVVFVVLATIPGLFVAVAEPGQNWILAAVSIGLLIAFSIASVRTVILFPAIAVDAPGATWRNAVSDTKGHGWYIFFLGLTALVPIATVGAIVVVAVLSALGLMLGAILVVPLVCVGMIVVLATMVAVASRLYERLGDRVNQPMPA
jgi:hypothetical protein